MPTGPSCGAGCRQQPLAQALDLRQLAGGLVARTLSQRSTWRRQEIALAAPGPPGPDPARAPCGDTAQGVGQLPPQAVERSRHRHRQSQAASSVSDRPSICCNQREGLADDRLVSSHQAAYLGHRGMPGQRRHECRLALDAQVCLGRNRIAAGAERITSCPCVVHHQPGEIGVAAAQLACRYARPGQAQLRLGPGGKLVGLRLSSRHPETGHQAAVHRYEGAGHVARARHPLDRLLRSLSASP